MKRLDELLRRYKGIGYLCKEMTELMKSIDKFERAINQHKSYKTLTEIRDVTLKSPDFSEDKQYLGVASAGLIDLTVRFLKTYDIFNRALVREGRKLWKEFEKLPEEWFESLLFTSKLDFFREWCIDPSFFEIDDVLCKIALLGVSKPVLTTSAYEMYCLGMNRFHISEFTGNHYSGRVFAPSSLADPGFQKAIRIFGEDFDEDLKVIPYDKIFNLLFDNLLKVKWENSLNPSVYRFRNLMYQESKIVLILAGDFNLDTRNSLKVEPVNKEKPLLRYAVVYDAGIGYEVTKSIKLGEDVSPKDNLVNHPQEDLLSMKRKILRGLLEDSRDDLLQEIINYIKKYEEPF